MSRDTGPVLRSQPFRGHLQAGFHHSRVAAVRLDGSFEGGIARPAHDLAANLREDLRYLRSGELGAAAGDRTATAQDVAPQVADGARVLRLLAQVRQRRHALALECLIDGLPHLLPGLVHLLVTAEGPEKIVRYPVPLGDDKQSKARLVLLDVGRHDHLPGFHQSCDLLQGALRGLPQLAVDNLRGQREDQQGQHVVIRCRLGQQVVAALAVDVDHRTAVFVSHNGRDIRTLRHRLQLVTDGEALP
mmetsp:Transcript_75627/g.225432  ORF Transcript_75627/g.225432 Transcript_75627/m.225432 type:complete len:246 (+) Transcript_75627:1169-1906(+)